MYANVFTWICLFLVAGLCDRVTAPCNHFELLDCGADSKMWAICRSKTVGIQRILSAQLDIRYPNKYCRRYGTPENFGLTTSGRSMWTVGWCFGTFFLCLEIDTHGLETYDVNVSITADSPIADYDEYSSEVLYVNQTTDQITNITDTKHTTAENVTTSDDITTTAFIHGENIVKTEQDITELDEPHGDNLHSSEEQQQLPAIGSSVSSHRDAFVNEYNGYGVDPRLKFWLIFAIISGGVIIVFLIGVIGYLTMQCNNNTDQSSVTKPSRTSNDKYFRQQKWSTSALMPPESDYSADVYDFIPADKPIHNPYDRTTCELSNTTSCGYSDTAKAENSYKTNGETSEEQSASLLRENNKRANDYFMLLPNDVTDSAVNPHLGDVQVYAHATESPYDRLNYSPNISLSDASTYNHLHFHRDTCITDGQQCIYPVNNVK